MQQQTEQTAPEQQVPKYDRSNMILMTELFDPLMTDKQWHRLHELRMARWEAEQEMEKARKTLEAAVQRFTDAVQAEQADEIMTLQTLLGNTLRGVSPDTSP